MELSFTERADESFNRLQQIIEKFVAELDCFGRQAINSVRTFGNRRTVIPFNAILPLKWDLKKSNSVCRSLFFNNLLIFYFRVED